MLFPYYTESLLKYRHWLCFLDQLGDVAHPHEIITDVHAQEFKAAYSLHLRLSDFQWLLRSSLLPHVHYYLLGLVYVERQVVDVTP